MPKQARRGGEASSFDSTLYNLHPRESNPLTTCGPKMTFGCMAPMCMKVQHLNNKGAFLSWYGTECHTNPPAGRADDSCQLCLRMSAAKLRSRACIRHRSFLFLQPIGCGGGAEGLRLRLRKHVYVDFARCRRRGLTFNSREGAPMALWQMAEQKDDWRHERDGGQTAGVVPTQRFELE